MKTIRYTSGYLAILFVASATCLSCKTFTPPERGKDVLGLPDSFTLYEPAAPAPDRWWETMASEELNTLIDTALSDNFTLAQAVARIRQASALAKQSRASLWPQLNFSADASVTRSRTDTGVSPDRLSIANQKLNALSQLLDGTGVTSVQSAQSKLNATKTLLEGPVSSVSYNTTESYQPGLTVSYEADIWGRLRASEQSALLELEASCEEAQMVMQSVASEVVLTWLDVLLYEQTLDILQRQLETNEINLELIELRYRKGISNALDVYQQRQAVTATKSNIPPVKAQCQTLRHQLAVLLGKTPRSPLGLSEFTFPDAGLLPEQGLPADLLAKRPDVRQAGLRLKAADWSVCAARSDRLPSLTLSASAALNADDIDLLFDNWMARLAASVTGPIFDAGRRKAEVERTQAVVEERLAGYKNTVLTAVREVEDALVLEARQKEYIDSLETQYETARKTHREALRRYQKGLTDYLPVLSALTSQQTLERSLVTARHDLLAYRVQLYLALGGSWMEAKLEEVKG